MLRRLKKLPCPVICAPRNYGVKLNAHRSDAGVNMEYEMIWLLLLLAVAQTLYAYL